MNMNYLSSLRDFFGTDIPDFEPSGKFYHYSDGTSKKPYWAIGTNWTYNGNSYWVVHCGSFKNPDMKATFKSWGDNQPPSKTFERSYKIKANELRLSIEKEKEERHVKCEITSIEVFNSASTEINHKYITSKNITPFKARQLNSELLIPVYNGDKLSGLQKILPDGSKFYSTGIRIKGSYLPLKEFNDSKRIYVAEGYANACTIQMAVNDPVITCFSANNISPAIESIRSVNPSCEIIICADCDLINEKTGYKTGQHYAEKAQREFENIAIAYPSKEDVKCDFNDIYMLNGDLDEISELISLSEDDLDSQQLDKYENYQFTTTNEKGKIIRDYDALIDFFCIKYKYFYMDDIKQFYMYNGSHYEKVQETKFHQFAREHLKPAPSNHERYEFVSLAKIHNVKNLNDIKDKNKWLINFKNGVYNIKTRSFDKSHHSYMFMTVIPWNYDPKAKCPKFDEMLNNCSSDKSIHVSVIYEYIGFILSDLPMDNIQKFLILSGAGENGKSTIVNKIMEIAGENNCESVSLVDLSRNRFAAIRLENCLLNVCEEEPKESFHNTANIKKLTGGSPVQVEEKGKPSYSIISRAKLIMTYNEMPELRDFTRGMLRRLIIIPFDIDFRQNPELKVDLTDIHLEYPGVINKALSGLHNLLMRGDFIETDASAYEKDKMVNSGDSVLGFITECIEEDISSMFIIPNGELYDAFIEYTGDKSVSRRSFCSRFSALLSKSPLHRNISSCRSNKSRGYKNLKINI